MSYLQRLKKLDAATLQAHQLDEHMPADASTSAAPAGPPAKCTEKSYEETRRNYPDEPFRPWAPACDATAAYEETTKKLRRNYEETTPAPLLAPTACQQCGWPTTLPGPLCLTCRHTPPCRICGGTRRWRPRPNADPAYTLCVVCYPPPDTPPRRQYGIAPTPPRAIPPDRQGHRACLCRDHCDQLLPEGQYFHT
jgi:hypothetical protein